MVSGIFHSGSGLGNQLHRYVATRVLALDKGYDFSMVAPENFKGSGFMDLDFGFTPNRKDLIPSDLAQLDRGEPLSLFPYKTEHPTGKVIPLGREVWEEKTNYYNPEFNFIEDNTIIDGEFQDERYFEYYIFTLANRWLKVEKIHVPDDVCVIGFRGGEFYLYPELGLPKEYFEEGMRKMRDINPNMKFEIHTDDTATARQFFPDIASIHDIGINWRSMRYAKYAIIANSSFYILPRLCRHAYNVDGEVTIAPRYWARRNTKEWSMPANYYKSFLYI